MQAAGRRLDQVLADLFPQFSRACLQRWIRAGEVYLEGKPVTAPRFCLRGGERVSLPESLIVPEAPRQPVAQPLSLPVLYEDPDLLVVDKAPGQVVHPGAGHPDGTLLNALLHHLPGNLDLPQGGLLHRLDRDTSGLLVVAKNAAAYAFLSRRLRRHRVEREYLALVDGFVTGGGRVEEPLGRHPKYRRRRAVTRTGRSARTDYRVLERFHCHSLLQLRLGSGRTHQLRVHLAHIGHPVTGDPLYGRGTGHPAGCGAAPAAAIAVLGRQALHACRLELEHPVHGSHMLFRSPLPQDIRYLLDSLREEKRDA